MIEPITTHTDAGAAINAFLVGHAAELPAFTREKVIAAAGMPSPVDRYVRVVEALYGAKSEIPKEGRVLAARLARFLANEGFHGMAGGRGQAIAGAMLRIGGYAAPEGTSWPTAEEDPAPLNEFVEPAEGEGDAPIAGEPRP